MKPFLCGLVALGLLLGAAGQARSDLMYWTDNPEAINAGDIRRANLDGTGQEILFTRQNKASQPLPRCCGRKDVLDQCS